MVEFIFDYFHVFVEGIRGVKIPGRRSRCGSYLHVDHVSSDLWAQILHDNVPRCDQ